MTKQIIDSDLCCYEHKVYALHPAKTRFLGERALPQGLEDGQADSEDYALQTPESSEPFSQDPSQRTPKRGGWQKWGGSTTSGGDPPWK